MPDPASIRLPPPECRADEYSSRAINRNPKGPTFAMIGRNTSLQLLRAGAHGSASSSASIVNLVAGPVSSRDIHRYDTSPR